MGLFDRLLDRLFGAKPGDLDALHRDAPPSDAPAPASGAAPGDPASPSQPAPAGLLGRAAAAWRRLVAAGAPRGRWGNRWRSVPRRRPPDGEHDRLARHGLPRLADRADLARRLGITPRRLAFLADRDQRVARHYRTWSIPKRRGGERTLRAPLPELRRAQDWIRRELLDRVAPEPPAHAYARRRSVATHAAPHVGRAVVVTLDLEEFFPSITFRRVRGVFAELGYGRDVAALLALLCTTPHEPGRTFSNGRARRALPQGAPTSPALSNLVCRRLDRRLGGLARRFGAAYTRYADDLTFSGDEALRARLPRFLRLATHIIRREGFALNWAKRRIMRPSGRQVVTGLVVNDPAGATLPRAERRRLRAMVHRAAQGRPLALPPGRGPGSEGAAADGAARAYLDGRLAYLAMIDPRRAAALRRRLPPRAPGA